jgi:biotin-(acetyl-CoA carboxylase) ligase
VGIGINADWPAELFPAPLRDGMTSLREVAGGRPVDRDALLEAWLARLEPRYEALRAGRFDAGGWSSRQRTTGASVEVTLEPGTVGGIGTGVDPESGALLLEVADGSPIAISTGEVVRCRVRSDGDATPASA